MSGKAQTHAQNIHKLALFCLFNPLFSQKICLIHQLPALMLDLISSPYNTLASDPHDLVCSWMLQAPSIKGNCEIPQCNTLYTHVHLFTSCSTCMPDYWLLRFINLWGHCLQSQAAIATFMELTCLTSEIGKSYIVIALVLLQTRELLIVKSWQ